MMRRIIQHQETLIDYDSPQLFVGYDQFNVQYLCLLVECTDTFEQYLCVPVTSKRLIAFYQESVDLRDIYDNPESNELFYAKVADEMKDIQLIPIVRESLSEEWLPERDFYFKKDNATDNLVESPSVYQFSKEQIQDLLDLLKYKPLLELLNQQQGVT
ncbi:conserved hypothetical protein [Beggiatoa sp. PS]|nr:conserved hypothetical protein [Beggiatoa sp. PS]